jgi:hypothetical protein
MNLSLLGMLSYKLERSVRWDGEKRSVPQRSAGERDARAEILKTLGVPQSVRTRWVTVRGLPALLGEQQRNGL